MDWFKEGSEGAEAAKEEDARRQAQRDTPFRFWLPPDKETQITFLDTKGFYFREHNLYLNGSWKNWETCIQDIGEEDCPLCEHGVKHSYVCAFTVIDHSHYTDRQGQKITISKKLIVLKATARNKVLKQKERRDGDLTGCHFSVARYTDKECSTGEDFNFEKRFTADELKATAPAGTAPEEWIAPFDYRQLFAPKSAKDLGRLVGGSPPVGSEDGPTQGKDMAALV